MKKAATLLSLVFYVGAIFGQYPIPENHPMGKNRNMISSEERENTIELKKVLIPKLEFKNLDKQQCLKSIECLSQTYSESNLGGIEYQRDSSLSYGWDANTNE